MWSLIHTQPKRSAFETRSARPTSRVHTEEARPYGVPLAHAIACASSLKRCTVMTGPKISRWIISSSCSSPATTVGSRKKPGPLGLASAGDDLGAVGAALEEALDARRAGGRS